MVPSNSMVNQEPGIIIIQKWNGLWKYSSRKCKCKWKYKYTVVENSCVQLLLCYLMYTFLSDWPLTMDCKDYGKYHKTINLLHTTHHIQYRNKHVIKLQ